MRSDTSDMRDIGDMMSLSSPGRMSSDTSDMVTRLYKSLSLLSPCHLDG